MSTEFESPRRDTSKETLGIDERSMEDDADEVGLKVDDEIFIPPPPRVFCEVDPTGPRLMITKIINENFKSYAGQQIIGPFHKVSITFHMQCNII